MKPFPNSYYHEPTGTYIPRLYGKTIYEWNKLGLFTMKDIQAYAENEEKEKRMDVIGANGNDGLHYEEVK